jgi:hypothetical protein
MPYCVNCGVELERSAEQCPLCGTRVLLPADAELPRSDHSRPQKRDTPPSDFDKGLWIQVVSVLMAIPVLISVVIDAVPGDGLTWSLYVVATLSTGWVWCVSPFLYRRNVVPLWIAIDSLALLGMLYVIDRLSTADHWFLPLALPITLGLSVLVLLVVTLSRRQTLRELHVVAAALIAIGVLCMIIEGAVDLYVNGAVRLQWSLVAAVTSAPLALIAVLLQRRRAVVEGMKIWFRP